MKLEILHVDAVDYMAVVQADFLADGIPSQVIFRIDAWDEDDPKGDYYAGPEYLERRVRRRLQLHSGFPGTGLGYIE